MHCFITMIMTIFIFNFSLSGVKINSISINNQAKDTSSLIIEGTNMHTLVPTLSTGKSMNLKIAYQYTLNKGSHQRTGQVDDGAHFIAYFFPRIAVYDDVDGWNKIPYSGAEEFYNDLQVYYAKNKGKDAIQEILDLL